MKKGRKREGREREAAVGNLQKSQVACSVTTEGVIISTAMERIGKHLVPQNRLGGSRRGCGGGRTLKKG